MNTLTSPRVAALLERLYRDADAKDPKIWARMDSADEETQAKLLDSAYMAVAPEVGKFLYALVRAKRPNSIVEFGTSYGLSTIYLAAALRDNGMGKVITTERSAEKAEKAKKNIAEAGLLDLVEIRLGDARESLKELAQDIEVLMLDGWKELYLPLLKMLEPRLKSGALVAADDIHLMPDELASYLAYVRDPAHGYVSVEIPLDDGVELSVKG